MQQIAEGLYVTSDLAPYHVGIIETPGGALLVDIPLQETARRDWLQEVRARYGHVRAVVLMDAAPERIFAAVGCTLPILAGEATLRRIDALRADERVWGEFVGMYARRFGLEPDEYAKRFPARVSLAVHKRATLHWRSQPITLESVTGGPHPGSVWVWLPDVRVLWTGDTVIVGEPPLFAPEQSWEDWETLLREVSRRPVARIVPGRGATSAFSGELETLHEFLRALQHTAQRLARASTLSMSELHRAAHDLQQGFFPHLEARSEAALRLRALLECQVTRYREQTCGDLP